MDRGAWWAMVHGVAKSQTQLSDYTMAMWLLHCYFEGLNTAKPNTLTNSSLNLGLVDKALDFKATALWKATQQRGRSQMRGRGHEG